MTCLFSCLKNILQDLSKNKEKKKENQYTDLGFWVICLHPQQQSATNENKGETSKLKTKITSHSKYESPP